MGVVSNQFTEIAQRMREMREILGIDTAEMAKIVEVSESEYKSFEAGDKDCPISVLVNAAEYFNIDLTELVTGEDARLSTYSIVRAGKGLPVKRRHSFEYQNMAYTFKHRKVEPLIVTIPYLPENEDKPISLSSHAGQEFDYVIKGKMKLAIDGHTDILEPGDLAYYSSDRPHGMIAVGGSECIFMACVIKD